jgi:hypothetical protein
MSFEHNCGGANQINTRRHMAFLRSEFARRAGYKYLTPRSEEPIHL